MPRTSFLIPARDAGATLSEALATVLAQTDPDFEVVVVDDGSRDHTRAVAGATGDRRVRVVVGAGEGLVAALNLGLSRCTGRFVARMDADDRASPHRLERQLPWFDADPGLAVVDGRARFFRDEGEVPDGMVRYAAWANAIVEPEDFDRELLIESPVHHPAATIRRDVLEAVGGYRQGDFPEDYDLWLRIHAAGHRLRKVPEVLVEMRDRPERTTRTDPRYRLDAFDVVRQGWLARRALQDRPRVALVGGGKRSRKWLRWLPQVCELVAIVDVMGPKQPRKGVPVVGTEALGSLEVDLALVAVGTAPSFPVIRQWIATDRPDWREGRHWWFV